MTNKCPNCKAELLVEHSFCPNCGNDLRASVSESVKEESQSREIIFEESTKEAENITKGDFKTPFVIALSFTVVSIFVWSFAYTNWKFNLDIFFNRLINHSVWILIVPYLISLAFKKPKRAKIYSNIVFIVIVLGIIFHFFGYSQVYVRQHPLIVRSELKQPCINNVIKQLDKVDVSYEIKKLRATKYCDCIIEKLSDTDLKQIGKAKIKFWTVITNKYSQENKSCVMESLSND